MADNPTIGSLRFQVTLATRVQTPDPAGTGIIETFTNPMVVSADVRPVGTQTYIMGEQTDFGITHRIFLRFLDNLDQFDVVLREIIRPAGGTIRQELFRIRRIGDWLGRQQFTALDVELEKRDG